MNDEWDEPIDRMVRRIKDTARRVGSGYPHWADPATGAWTTTLDGDWTGGYWLGMLWLASRQAGGEQFSELAERGCVRLAPRVTADTAFKAATFYYGAGLGALLAGSRDARTLGLAAARDLQQRFDPRLGLVPLGARAEEGSHVGVTQSSIDSLVVSLLLFWAASADDDASLRDVAARHTNRVLAVHLRDDGSFIQSSSLDLRDGRVLERYTHKGYSASSTWARAQAWGVLCSTMSYLHGQREETWLTAATRGADWWLSNIPEDGVSYWDFDAPQQHGTERDTAATAFMASAFLKLSTVAPTDDKRKMYREAGERAVRTLVQRFLTPVDGSDGRIPGMLVGGCFNVRADSRPEDRVGNAELIFGSYYLFEALHILSGRIRPDQI